MPIEWGSECQIQHISHWLGLPRSNCKSLKTALWHRDPLDGQYLARLRDSMKKELRLSVNPYCDVLEMILLVPYDVLGHGSYSSSGTRCKVSLVAKLFMVSSSLILLQLHLKTPGNSSHNALQDREG